MTVRRTYRCNLCNEDENRSGLIGLKWAYGSPGGALTIASPHQAEHHICATCADAIVAIMSARPEFEGGPAAAEAPHA